MTTKGQPSAMELETYQQRSVTIVALTGDLDGSTAPDVQTRLLPLIPDGGKMLLDMTGVPYMSSAGLRTMLLLYRHAQSVGSDIAVVGLSQELRDMMAATGFLDFFVLSDDVDAGVKALTA